MPPLRHRLTPPSFSARFSASITISFGQPESTIRYQEGILREKTKFFDVILPRTAEAKEAIAQAWAAANAPKSGSAAAPVDLEEPQIEPDIAGDKSQPKQDYRIYDAAGKPIVADYRIDAEYCTVPAVLIFTQGLDGLAPTVKDVEKEADCLYAYLIAKQLKYIALQDAIIEALRVYYAKNDVQFARINRLAKYTPDDTPDKMILFLIQQAARVYARLGEKQFKLSNIGYDRFMLQGSRYICKEITDAIGKHAEATGKRMGGSGAYDERQRKQRKADEEAADAVPSFETVDE